MAEGGYELWEHLIGFSMRTRRSERSGAIEVPGMAHPYHVFTFYVAGDKDGSPHKTDRTISCVRVTAPEVFRVATPEVLDKESEDLLRQLLWAKALGENMVQFIFGSSSSSSAGRDRIANRCACGAVRRDDRPLCSFSFCLCSSFVLPQHFA